MPDGSTTAVVASRENARVAAARRLQQRKHRERERRFLIEGPHALAAALDADAPVLEVFFLWGDASDAVAGVVARASRRGVPCVPVTRAVLAALDTTETPQGLVGVCGHLDTSLATVTASRSAVPILVETQDPGNLGTVIRSADASGAGGVVITHASVDLYNSKVVRATAGSLFDLPIVREVGVADAVRAFRATGFRVLASTADGSVSVHDADMAGRVAVLFGNEARGLPAEVVAMAEETVRIPLPGRAESLNLAAAATVVLFEAARQRSGADPPRGR